MTRPANDMCDKENAFTCTNWGLLLVYYFHRCAGTTAGTTSPRTERRLALPFAKYKAGREVLVFELTQPAWKGRHFLVAGSSTSTPPAAVISQRMTVAFAQHLCQAVAEGRNRAHCFSPAIFNKRNSGSSHKKESSATAHCSVKANANF